MWTPFGAQEPGLVLSRVSRWQRGLLSRPSRMRARRTSVIALRIGRRALVGVGVAASLRRLPGSKRIRDGRYIVAVEHGAYG
jgi:hypothetical protein